MKYQLQSQRRQHHSNAYLTVALSLIFGIILSLLLALIEGAAIGAARLQAEIVTDLGLDSVFAEYNRELLDQYGLFFVDTSYGTINGGMGMVESRLSDYMSYNLDPRKDKLVLYTKSMLLYLSNPYLEIEDISYATDGDGLVWKSMAVDYMKSTLGGDAISEVQDYINTVENKGLNTIDVMKEAINQKDSVDEILTPEIIEEYGDETDEEDYSYGKLSNIFTSLVGGTMLNIVTPSGDLVSKAVVSGGPYYSSRVKNGKVNKGSGPHSCIDRADGIVDELLFNEYLLNMCGTYTGGKDNGLLKYQIEYILFGNNSDEANIQECVLSLLGLRAAANLSMIYTNGRIKNEAELASLVICTILASPEAAEYVSVLILELWSIAEAYSDVNILLDNGRVPLMKNSDQWNIGLIDLFTLNLFSGTKKEEGITYNDYMKIMLNLIDKKDKLNRSLDIVEMDIRQTKGNSNFRIDRCIDYLSVKFGFYDGYGHEFLITRRKCYE